MNNRKEINRAVIWDMDGVIADTAHHHFLSWQYAFQKRGIRFTEEDFLRHFGQRNDTIIRDTAGLNVPADYIEAVARDKEENFRENIVKDLKAFPGVIDLLRALHAGGIISAVASSAPLENILLILERLNIRQYFRAIVFGGEVNEGKPSPQAFLLAAGKAGAAPANCIVIEDAVAGVTAAKRAGMRCIAVTNTYPAASLRQADLVVDSLAEINLETLNRLFNKSGEKNN